jgi:hypothetical protein
MQRRDPWRQPLRRLGNLRIRLEAGLPLREAEAVVTLLLRAADRLAPLRRRQADRYRQWSLPGLVESVMV